MMEKSIPEYDENDLYDEESDCLDSPDGRHCVHWYDGEECCYCEAK